MRLSGILDVMPAPSPLFERLQGDRRRRGWTLRKAAAQLSVTTETIRAWTAGETLPERWRAPELASFLETSETEVLRAMDEQDRQKRAARDLQTQIDMMRHEVRSQAERIDQLAALLDEIAERISGLPLPPDQNNGG